MISTPLKTGCKDRWSWNRREKSHEVTLTGSKNVTAHFHPKWSNGTAGVRGSRVLNNGRYYWEIVVSQRVFGTSMMFGIGTRKTRLHANSFVNMLGEDEHGWGLSHKGMLWHNGVWTQYTKPFRENESTSVGLLFDGIQGSLTYYKDRTCLGVAFTGIKTNEPVFPIVCSTAAKTEMTLGVQRRDFQSLQDRCRASIMEQMGDNRSKICQLPLPNRLKSYLGEEEDLSYELVRRRNGVASCYYV